MLLSDLEEVQLLRQFFLQSCTEVLKACTLCQLLLVVMKLVNLHNGQVMHIIYHHTGCLF